MTWSNSVGRDRRVSNANEVDRKSYPSPSPTSDDPRQKTTESPEDPSHPEDFFEETDPDLPMDAREAIKKISDTLCSKALSCPEISAALSWDECIKDIQKDRFLSSDFGINPRLSFEKILQGDGPEYTAGSKVTDRCVEEIENLSCDHFGKKDPVADLFPLEGETEGQPSPAKTNPEPDAPKVVGITVGFESMPPSVCRDTFKPKPVSCDPSAASVQIQSPAVQTLVNAICSKAATCSPGLSCEACFEGVMKTQSFADKVGLNRLTFQSIDFGMMLGIYHVNEVNLAQCLEAMRKDDCSRALYGYSSTILGNSDSCTHIFEKSKVSCDTGTPDPLTRFAEALCGTVITCRPEIPCDHCVEKIMGSNRISTRLGANQDQKQWRAWRTAGQDLSLTGLRGLIVQGRLVLDEAALEQCANDIDEQTCVKIQLGRGDYNPKGYHSLDMGIIRLFTGGSGSCEMAIHPPLTE